MQDLELILNFIKTIAYGRNHNEFYSELSSNDKELFCQLASDFKLCHIIYYYLHPFLSEKWKIVFGKEYRNASALELKRSIELKRIFEIFSHNQIISAPLKGSYLAYFAYPNPVLRRMSDIDILIPKEQIDHAWNLLKSKGYRAKINRIETHHKPVLISKSEFNIELHYHIKPFNRNDENKRFDANILWENSGKVSFFGIEVFALASEVALLHTIDHYFHDNLAGGFRPFLDTGFIISNLKPDINKITFAAKKMNLLKELELFSNIFLDFFPEEYRIPTNYEIDSYSEKAKLLIRNYNKININPAFKLGYFRDFNKKKFKDKVSFILNETFKKPAFIETKFQIKTNYFSLIYYYLLYYILSFSKFLKCIFSNKKNKLLTEAGEWQRNINEFLNK